MTDPTPETPPDPHTETQKLEEQFNKIEAEFKEGIKVVENKGKKFNNWYVFVALGFFIGLVIGLCVK